MTDSPTPEAGANAQAPGAIAWNDAARERAFSEWLARVAPAHQLIASSVRPASADASFRRYFRIDAAQGSRIIMDAPTDKEDSAPFVKVAALMAKAGVKAPQVLNWDAPQGFMLLDDLGSQTLLDVLDPAQPQAALPAFEDATDALIAWQLASEPNVLPNYDEALLRRELALFPDWYLARHRGVAVEGKLAQTLASTFDAVVRTNLASPSVFVHRDFMPRNLMVDPAGGRLGVLDFQDAVYGPITYDIACLTRDAFLSWDEEFVLDVTVRYWQKARKAGLPVDDDFGMFYRAVEWMGLQRHLKVAGIFARLTLRDGKPRYLADTPRFIGYIRATASRYRELTPLLRLVDEVEGIHQQSGYAFGRV
ncbi:phosphotransferase [Variovorax dokdonensis]|uniref:Phosphotransferase n=1 Tax=Variovorax dokdonensis TaxID=344883 RepID=A0ABT7N9F3_9BURK|nr:phosphotransferase [Variovorax dokdonensis]MDM0044569.1 phosphotransferase [Variovorax dokdonensis]